jgi:hypothetical protein
MSLEDLERELKATKNKIEGKIRDKLKSKGLIETYDQAIKKSNSWDDISSLLKYGSTSPSLMFEPRPKLLIFFILVALVSGFLTFSKTHSTIPIFIFIAAIALISLTVWAIISANKWSSLKWKYQREAESELQISDKEYQALVNDQKELEEIVRNQRDIELSEYRRKKEESASRRDYENKERMASQEQSTTRVCAKCNKEKDWRPHVFTPWHRCNKCGASYCDTCVGSFPRDYSSILGGIILHKCPCGGRTEPDKNL